MKRVRVALLCLLVALGCQPLALWAQEPVLDAANAFVTRWQGKAGKPIKVPLYGKYEYRWEKANGTLVKAGVATVADGKLLELDVPADGAYVLKAGPRGVKRIEFGVLYLGGYYISRGTPKALLQVVQWGSVSWESFGGAFYGCENMNVAEGAGTPDLSGVASMQSAFWGCKSFNSPIGAWDVSKVTSMAGMFKWCVSFNQPLEKWDVSKVTDMERMFSGCTSFNQPLEKWDVSKVTSMREMFDRCVSFNQPLGAWDVSRVENMGRMFRGCGSFNQPLEKWDVSKVTSMGGMFEGCTSFNQPLEKWDVSQVTSMREMFKECSSFNQPLEKWDVSRVTSMEGMFEGCTSFNQPLEKWDVSKVENFGGMFGGCSTFNQPLEKWDVSLVTYMWNMFSGCSAFNQPLGGWTLASLSSSISFGEAKLSVANYSSMLEAWAAKRDQLLGGVRVSAHGLFFDAAGAAARQQLINGKGWAFEGDRETVPVPPLDAANAFITRWQGQAGEMIRVPLYGQYSYEWVRVAGGAVVASGEVRVGETRLLELAVPADGEYVLRAGPAGVKRIEFGKIGQRDIGGWHYTYVYDSSRGTPRALLRVVQWGSVAWESFGGAFYGCENMNIAEGAGKPDLSGVQSMQSTFEGCKSFNSPIGDWDVSRVTDMKWMFYECVSFNQPLERWDVSKVTSMWLMFDGCSLFDQPLERWDVSRVTSMRGMFDGCSLFDQPLGGWTLSVLAHGKEGNHDLGLKSSGLSVANYSQTLAAWAAKMDQLQHGVRVNAQNLFFNEAGKAARQQLIDRKGWVFEGDRETVPVPPLDAANAFITRWQGKAGERIGVPLYGEYSYEWVRVADGSVVASGAAYVGEASLLGLAVPADGEYVLKAGPEGVKRIEFGKREKRGWYQSYYYYVGSRGAPEALLQVSQWGSVAWESLARAFYGCENMRIAEGAGRPDLSGVTSMQSAFEGCKSFNSPIGAWDVSGVTDMRAMFKGCSSFNQPLEGWDVSRVTDMEEMFRGCSTFNQPLEGWDVSRVTEMGGMFNGCSAFNQPLGAWDVSSVKDMGGMFNGCSAFNQPLGAWDVSSVTNMGGMFSGCSAFNQPLGGWRVLQVTSMRAMFSGCSSFNQPLAQWDVSQVENMEEMLSGCVSFNQPLDGWTLSALEYRDLGLGGSGLSVGNYSSMLTAWVAKSDRLQRGVRVKAEGLRCNAAGAAARQQLMDRMYWKFEGDGEATMDSPAVDIVDAPGWLTVGERHAFTAKVEPAAAPQAVVWSVDGAGAEFTGNELKVTKMGIITVTATALADPKPSRSVRIGVMAMPARLAILDAPTRLYVDRPHTFRAKVEPAGALQEVTWSVAEGEAWGSFTGSVLTAKQTGTITVTATAVANPKLSQSVRIEVAAYVPLSGLAVSPTSARLEIGGTQMLTVRYTPSDATNRAVTWSSSDKRVATVDAEGKVTGVAVGSATITAMSADGGCMATCAVTVNSPDTPPPSPSVAESVQLAGVSVSPNPFGDYLIVRGAAGVQRYALVRASGAVVLEGAHTGGDELGVSTSHLPAGIYWLRLVASDGERVLGVVRW